MPRMFRRDLLKVSAGLAAGGLTPASGQATPGAPSPIMVASGNDQRQRLENIAECHRGIHKCLRKHLVSGYLPGQVVYNLGEYPCRKPWDPDEWDEGQLEEMAAAGIQLVQLHEEWNDALRLFRADKFSPLNPAGFRRFVEMVHRKGMKLIVYISSGFFERRDPDFKPEWARSQDLVEIYFRYATCSPTSPGWRAYLFPRLVHILDEYGVDGFYNDLGYTKLFQPGTPPSKDEIAAFEESPSLQGGLEDLLGIIYDEVKRRGGIVKVHSGGNSQPKTSFRVYDYLWVGEGIRNADTMREAVKNHLPYVVPCLDMSRARVEREDDLYLNIPYLQFPILLGGRPFTGERAAIPGVEYQPAFWTDHLRSIWRYYQAHPEGPFSYGWWDSCPGRRDARPAYYRWLKLYRRMAENGTWAWLEVTASDLFMEPLPEGVVASVFANRRIYLALANYSQRPVHVRTRKPHVGAEVPGEPATSWTIAPRSLTVLVTV